MINKNRKVLLYAAIILAIILLIAVSCNSKVERSTQTQTIDTIVSDSIVQDTTSIDSL